MPEIARSVPNWNIISPGGRSVFNIANIRGLNNTLLYSGPSVVFYLDDVPFGITSSYATQLYGLDSIEVFRGPQRSRFGKNSYGGVFKAITRAPHNELEGQLNLQRGNFDQWLLDGALSGAIIQDRLLFSLNGALTRRDGFMKNTFLDTRPDSQKAISGRAKLVWKPNEDWEIRLLGAVDEFNDGPFRSVPLSSESNDLFEVNSDFDGEIEQRSDLAAFSLKYQSEGFEVFGVTSWRNWELDPLALDADLSPQPILKVFATQEQDLWNHEIRLRSVSQDCDWDWGMGLFSSASQIHLDRVIEFLGQSGETRNQLEEDAIAGFFNISYNGFANLRLHADMRFDSVEQSFDRIRQDPFASVAPIKLGRADWFVSPGIGIDFLLSEQMLLYVKTGLAFKPGGFSPATDNPTFAEFGRERVWDSEIGLRWHMDRFAARLALFYYDIEDYQVERFITPFDYTILNAPEALSYGLEVEVEARILDGLLLETAFGFVHTEFNEFRDPITNEDNSGNAVPFVPEFNLMLAANYQHPLGFLGRIELLWTGETEFDDSNTSELKEGDYSLVNARIGYKKSGFSAYAFVKNLTDTEYFSFKSATINLIPSGTPGEPRTYGIKIGYKF